MADKKPMTKSAIIQTLADKTEVPKKKVAELLEALKDLAYAEAEVGFTFPGVGKLVKSVRKAREGHNPKTGQKIKIPAKTVLKFRVAKAAKDAIAAPKAKKAAAKPAAKAAAKPAAKAAAKAPAKKAKK